MFCLYCFFSWSLVSKQTWVTLKSSCICSLTCSSLPLACLPQDRPEITLPFERLVEWRDWVYGRKIFRTCRSEDVKIKSHQMFGICNPKWRQTRRLTERTYHKGCSWNTDGNMRILAETERCANTRVFVRWAEPKWIETECCCGPNEIKASIILLRAFGVRIAKLVARKV